MLQFILIRSKLTESIALTRIMQGFFKLAEKWRPRKLFVQPNRFEKPVGFNFIETENYNTFKNPTGLKTWLCQL
jgi:hypothetical protein